MNTEKGIMTPQDVAKETRSSLRFIYKELKKGVIPHVRLGDKYLIGRKAFEAWLNGNTSVK
jgi:excisionase family DNA binding protein